MTTLLDGSAQWSAGELAWLQSHRDSGNATALGIARLIPNPKDFVVQWPRIKAQVPRGRNIPATEPTPIHNPDFIAVGFFDLEFPDLLREIPNPPAVLWVRGELKSDVDLLAVVGTRHPTDYGEEWARVATRAAISRGMGVVSGLAIGIDTVAHRTALEEDGYTIAVLGGSLAHPTPRQNRPLARDIVESGGALVCESPPDADSDAGRLVQRNRIQSGLSLGTFTAQTGIPGGTLHTARFAIEQGRRLIVPSTSQRDRIIDPRNFGNNRLTDPNGMNPADLGAKSKRSRALIASLRPVADESPINAREVRDAIDRL